MLDKVRQEAASMIAAIWLGMILGVSFFAAPIKFAAPGVALEELLLVGKVTFQAFTWVEFAAFAFLVGASVGQLTRPVIIGIIFLLVLLIIQKFAVLPRLDSALVKTVAGQPTTENVLHFVYGLIDVLKLVALFVQSLLLRSTNEASSRE